MVWTCFSDTKTDDYDSPSSFRFVKVNLEKDLSCYMQNILLKE